MRDGGRAPIALDDLVTTTRATFRILESLRNGLPCDAMSRPKTGFTVPLWQWLRKSEATTGWKRVPYLQRPKVHDYSRWAYTLLSIAPDTADLLKA